MSNVTELIPAVLTQECAAAIASLIPTNPIYALIAITSAGLLSQVGTYLHLNSQLGGIVAKCFNIETGTSTTSAGNAASAATAEAASK